MYNEKKMQQRLIGLRKRRGLCQHEVAEKVGMSQCAVCAYETGRSVPKLEFLDAIADFYGVSIDWLTGRTDKKIPRTDG